MEPERTSRKKGEQGRSGLWAMGLFLLVPLAAVLAFTSQQEGPNPLPPTPLKGTEKGVDPDDPTQDRAGQSGDEWGGEITRRHEGFPPLAAPIEHAPPPSEGTSSEPTAYAREDAARLERFDANARAFDERLAAFGREQGQVDDASSVSLEERMQAALQPLHPDVRVSASCTQSVCVVKLSSPEPVGTMIARISPWLRNHTRAATGDPADDSDESSMRLAFEKPDVLVDF